MSLLIDGEELRPGMLFVVAPERMFVMVTSVDSAFVYYSYFRGSCTLHMLRLCHEKFMAWIDASTNAFVYRRIA